MKMLKLIMFLFLTVFLLANVVQSGTRIRRGNHCGYGGNGCGRVAILPGPLPPPLPPHGINNSPIFELT